MVCTQKLYSPNCICLFCNTQASATIHLVIQHKRTNMHMLHSISIQQTFRACKNSLSLNMTWVTHEYNIIVLRVLYLPRTLPKGINIITQYVQCLPTYDPYEGHIHLNISYINSLICLHNSGTKAMKRHCI